MLGQAAPGGFDVASLLTDGSSFALVAVALYGAWRVYRVVRDDEREGRAVLDVRLDNLRWNQRILLEHVASVSRLVPPEIEVPELPELRAELHGQE